MLCTKICGTEGAFDVQRIADIELCADMIGKTPGAGSAHVDFKGAVTGRIGDGVMSRLKIAEAETNMSARRSSVLVGVDWCIST